MPSCPKDPLIPARRWIEYYPCHLGSTEVRKGSIPAYTPDLTAILPYDLQLPQEMTSRGQDWNGTVDQGHLASEVEVARRWCFSSELP